MAPIRPRAMTRPERNAMNENVDVKRGGENRSNFIGDILTTSVKYFKWIVLAIVLVILFSGLCPLPYLRSSLSQL